MRRASAVPPEDPVAAASAIYATIQTSLDTAASTLKEVVEKLQAAAPQEVETIVNVPGLGVRRTSTASGSEAFGSVAFRHALRDLVSLREAMPAEEFATALHAAAALRDRVRAEVARAKDDQAHEKHTERQRITGLEERLRLADSQCDLLRNAVARRDSLLAQQRSAYYRDVLAFKATESTGPAPAKTYEEMIEKAKIHPVTERPSFFDAMIFESLHLAVDMGPAEKQQSALKMAAAREAQMLASASQEANEARRMAAEERRRREELEAAQQEAVSSLEASVEARVRAGIDRAISEVKHSAKEGVEMAWERARELEAEREEMAAAMAAQSETLAKQVPSPPSADDQCCRVQPECHPSAIRVPSECHPSAIRVPSECH